MSAQNALHPLIFGRGFDENLVDFPRITYFQAEIGRQRAKPSSLPFIDHKDSVLGIAVIGVGYESDNANNLPFTQMIDLDHDSHKSFGL